MAALTFSADGQHPKNVAPIVLGYSMLFFLVCIICAIAKLEVPTQAPTEAPTEDPALPVEGDTKVDILEGSDIQIPMGLYDAGYDSLAKIQEALLNSMWAVDENIDGIALLGVDPKYFDGTQWILADETFFPDGIMEVLLPYPAGTNINTQFTVLNMVTSDQYGQLPGTVELLMPENTEDGILVYVANLSPVMLGWNIQQAIDGGADVEEPEAPEAPTDAPTEAPTEAPEAPSETPTEPNVPSNPETGDTGVAMIVALLVVALFGMVAVVYVDKKRIV